MPFIPSVGVGGHCIPVDPSYLSHAANRVGLETKFINHANEVNLAMPDFVASRIESSHGASLKGVRIQVAGISYKADISDLRESPAIALIASLRRKGAEVQWHRCEYFFEYRMAKIPMSQPVYDSQARGRVFKDTFKAFWDYRELILLLVKRDIAVRYKRSFLGLIWTLLNPLLTSLVLWFVFITIFSARLPDGTQFAPYLLAGVLIVTFFTQGFNQAADSIAQGSGILMKIYVPPQVFAFAGAVSNAVNFCFGLIALAFISLITGDGISLYFPLTIFVILFMLMYVTGLGLLVAVAYIRYDDTRSIFGILISFMMYLSPIFYP